MLVGYDSAKEAARVAPAESGSGDVPKEFTIPAGWAGIIVLLLAGAGGGGGLSSFLSSSTAKAIKDVKQSQALQLQSFRVEVVGKLDRMKEQSADQKARMLKLEAAIEKHRDMQGHPALSLELAGIKRRITALEDKR